MNCLIFKKSVLSDICFSLITRHKIRPLLDCIVTCDEKWISFNKKLSNQWMDKLGPSKHFPKPEFHEKKIIVTVWWSAVGVIHYNFMKSGQNNTAETYYQQLNEMYGELYQKQPSLINRKCPILLHDNAWPHTSRITIEKLTTLQFEVLSPLLYSPDLSPTDYHLFKHLDFFFFFFQR